MLSNLNPDRKELELGNSFIYKMRRKEVAAEILGGMADTFH